MRISDWSSDVCSSDLPFLFLERHKGSVSRAMSDELEQLVQSAQADIAACADARTLETLRVDLLGKKGRVTDLLKQLGGMAPEARKAFGEQVNRAKEALSSALETRGDELARIALDARLASERNDVTLAARGEPGGGDRKSTRLNSSP